MTRVCPFFLQKLFSFIFNVAHFWFQVELYMYSEIELNFLKYRYLNL